MAMAAHQKVDFRSAEGEPGPTGRKSVYLYQLHNPASVLGIEGMVEGLIECVEAGLTRRWGSQTSIKGPDAARLLHLGAAQYCAGI